MKIKLLTIGKTSFDFLRQGESEYEKRLVHYCQFERLNLNDVKSLKNNEDLKTAEGKEFLSKIDNRDYVVLLDENGKEMSSVDFAKWLENRKNYFPERVVFIIGGAFGFSDEVKARANTFFSMSKMTFSHQMVRMIFLEQLYRGFSIIAGESYHHV